MLPTLIKFEHTQSCLKSQKAVFSVLALDQFTELLRQLADSQIMRPAHELSANEYARLVVWNPLTDKEYYRGGEFNERDSVKPTAEHIKKTLVSLVPTDGKFKVDYQQQGIALLFDVDLCHLKAENYMFSGKVDTTRYFWLKKKLNLSVIPALV